SSSLNTQTILYSPSTSTFVVGSNQGLFRVTPNDPAVSNGTDAVSSVSFFPGTNASFPFSTASFDLYLHDVDFSSGTIVVNARLATGSGQFGLYAVSTRGVTTLLTAVGSTIFCSQGLIEHAV